MTVCTLTRANKGPIATQAIHQLIAEGFELVDGDADVLLSLQYDKRISYDTIKRYPIALNLHNAKLPEYKGFNTISHAILNGERRYYSTLHWLTNEIDGGDIAYEVETLVHDNDTAISLYTRTLSACHRLIELLMADLKAGKLPPKRPQEGAGRYYGKDSDKRILGLEDLPLKARAWHFPPHAPAYLEIDGTRYGVAPL